MVADFSSNDKELLRLNEEGFIPGPGENESTFLERVEKMKARAEKNTLPPSQLEWIYLYLKEIFDFKPKYLQVTFSNKGLTPWQGGATWIEEGNVVSLQLNKRFAKGSFLGYAKEEIIAHEAIHVARAAFQETRFEEFFAYYTSEKKWRKVLGPIVRRPWEVWPLLFFFCVGAFVPLFSVGALLWVFLGFTRLILGHFTLRRASNALLKVVKDKKTARAILFRLTDKEISLFAKGEDVLSYAHLQQELRWRLIRLYIKESYGKKN